MKNKLFGKHTGLPASELILGAASFGGQRNGTPAEEIQKILAAYADAGGNFIDMADQYQFGEAEVNVGRFVQSQRHNFILCTKYTRSSLSQPLPANFGNHRKAMRQAVDESLKRLRTDYIDVFMPHYDDGLTPLEEIARGLEDLLKAGKIIYAGLANFPAWKAAVISKDVRLTALQIEYNMAQRTAERELMPMADHQGLGTMLYSPLAGGLLTGKYRHGASGRLTSSGSAGYQESAAVTAILNELEAVAAEVSATPGEVALAWVLAKDAFPIIGVRRLAHLTASLKALDLRLTPEQQERLNTSGEIALGYPHDLLKSVQVSY